MPGFDGDDPTARLLAWGDRQPGATAFVAPGRTPMTFGELAQRIRAVGDRLGRWGIRRGDVVVWPNLDRATCATAQAILPASSTLVPLPKVMTAAATEELLRRLRPKALALPAGATHPVADLARPMGIATLSVVADAQGVAGAFELELSAPERSLDRDPALPPEFAYVSATSGSTGRPKLVPHGRRQLMAMIRAAAERLAIGPGDVSAHVVPLHLASGMRPALMFSLLNGGAVAILPEVDAPSLLAAIARGDVTYLTAPFTFHRELLSDPQAIRRAAPGRLRYVRVASGRLEADEMDRLEEAFGVPVTSALASTECGTVAHQELPPAPRRRGSVGPPLSTEIRIVDDGGRDVPGGEVGEILVRGPQVFDGYLDDPEANADAFVDGWFRMGDLGRLDEHGELHVVGRLKEVINRGGDKISPSAIDPVMRAVPGVVDAAAFGVPHPRLGEEVVAAVVPAPRQPCKAEDVIEAVRRKLGSRAAPRQVWFVDELPRTELGKVRRAALTERFGAELRAESPEPAESVEARSPLEIALAGLWSSVLGIGRVRADDNFFMIGGDSLRGAQLVELVRAVFGVTIRPETLFDEAATLRSMARLIESKRTPAPSGTSVPTLPRRADGVRVPLSDAQARVWFLQRLDPRSSAYHEARLWRIDGDVDADALRAALRAVALHQPMLRTRFANDASGPRQVIETDPGEPLAIVDLAGEPGDTERYLRNAVRDFATRPFDLAAAPPMRWVLFRLAARRFALLRVWHHILGDALSARILQREVSDAYAATRAGREPAFRPLDVDFADYAVWQSRPEAAASIERSLPVWKARLADLPQLALPTDFVRPQTVSSNGAVHTSRLSRDASEAMKRVGRRHGATPFVTFLAAFQVLLSRLSGDTDFAVGTPVAGRALPELSPIIGFFANTVVLRADLSGAPDANTLIQRARDRVREALDHQQVPFEKLVEALAVPRDPSRNPLFQVAFALREPDPADLRLVGAEVVRAETGIGRAKFDLLLSLQDESDGVVARWEYCTDLFEAATVARMAGQYECLVEATAAAPDAPVATLPMMDEPTRARVVAACSPPATPFPADATLHGRFAAQAASTPDARAIETLDYAALDAAANRLAHDLRAQGVGRGDFVAVSLRRTADVAAAWLAVLKCGAAYLPVDPDLPAERIAFMLDDARAGHLVADAMVASRLARPGMPVTCPDRDAARIGARDAGAPTDDAGPDDPAYVIYTSGSTGTPKGVVVPHRAVLRLVCDTDYVKLGRDDVVAQMANPAFDASTFELWGPLLNGAQIVPIAKTTAIAPRALALSLARQRVTTLFLTTALFNAVARDAPDALRACRTVMFGGEAVEPRWVHAVRAAGPPQRLLHVYGPTETTTFATWHPIGELPTKVATIPIGRPIANTSACVLRPDGELAAPGEPGEIWIGGPGVALGYLARPELTNERFVRDPSPALPRGVWYRTGDRGRLNDAGAIEFLGRVDHQVKVRGHRVELGEIEAAIGRLPAVREAVVSLVGDTSDTRQIVAHLVRADPAAPPPDNLLGELRRTLPDYMLPTTVVWLPSLPLNASGKVDRRALTVPEAVATRRGGAATPPRDMLEELLLRIWEDLLGVKGIGVLDHFFDIGGHSLLAARLVDAIERETGIAIPLTAMFADDTIAGLATALREGAPNAGAPILSFNERGSRPPFVFLHGDFTGGGFYSRALVQALGPDQPVLLVHPHGLVGDSVPDTIEAMAADRVAALRRLRPHGPYVVGGHCNGAFVAFEMARRLIEDGEQVASVVVVEARAPGGAVPGEHAPRGDSWVTFDAFGKPRNVTAQDRQSDFWLRYLRAMDRYAGHRSAAHVVVVRSRELVDPRRDLGWSRFAASVEVHDVPGTHTTLITLHLGELVTIVREAIGRALARTLS
jgi:amino acid adenylation domain-containing protein